MRWVLIADGANRCDCAIGEFIGTADELVEWFQGLLTKHNYTIEAKHTKSDGQEPESIRFWYTNENRLYLDGDFAGELCEFGDVRGDFPYGYTFEQIDHKPGYQKFGKFFS